MIFKNINRNINYNKKMLLLKLIIIIDIKQIANSL